MSFGHYESAEPTTTFILCEPTQMDLTQPTDEPVTLPLSNSWVAGHPRYQQWLRMRVSLWVLLSA